MKKRNVMVAVIIFRLGRVFSMELKAQEALKALMKRCEDMESVTLTITVMRNREKGSVFTRIEFRDNTDLEKEFITAFHKDREKADNEIETKSGGRITEMLYQFDGISYIYRVQNNRVSFSTSDR
jgi:hypothetical protein